MSIRSSSGALRAISPRRPLRAFVRGCLLVAGAPALLAACGGGGDGGTPAPVAPATPTAVQATLGTSPGTIAVSFTPVGAADGYVVASVPAGLAGKGTTSPVTVACPGSCAGYAVTVAAQNATLTGTASAAVHVLTPYRIVTTWTEPMTAPSDSIFTGTFTLDSTSAAVSNLAGDLTQSMTGSMGAMSSVHVGQQLSSVADATGAGLLVTTFLLNTTNTFDVANGNQGWLPGPAPAAKYYGFAAGAANPSAGGTGNAYARVFIDTTDPTRTPAATQLAQTAYADCTAKGMMGSTCMTATDASVYGTVGTMRGYPSSQVVTRP